jgi:hypothetical protein
MVLRAVRLEPVQPLAGDLDPEEIEDPILRQQVLDGQEPAAQFFGGAAPYEPDQPLYLIQGDMDT